MQSETPFRLSTAGDDVCLAVKGDRWRVYMQGARRIGRDWFVQVLTLGPRARTFTIRVTTLPYEIATVKRILAVVSDCLHTGDDRGHVYLELSDEVH